MVRTIAPVEFAQLARHPQAPNAFTRNRQLQLLKLVASLLSQRAASQQAMLDGLFAALQGDPLGGRKVSDRAFAHARARLHMSALQSLNDQLVEAATQAWLVPR